MKKLILTIGVVLMSISLFGQTDLRRGVTVGVGDTIASIKSIAKDDNNFLYFYNTSNQRLYAFDTTAMEIRISSLETITPYDSAVISGGAMSFYYEGIELLTVDTTAMRTDIEALQDSVTAINSELNDVIEASEITASLDAIYVQDSMTNKDGKIAHYIGATQYYPAIQEERHIIRALQSMGSTIKAIPIFGDAIPIGTGALLHQRVQLTSLYLDKSDTITGAWIAPSVTGAYVTNANINKIGLYNVSGDTLRLIASTASDSTLWAQTDSTFYQKAFSAKVYAQRGYYAIAFFYSRASSTTSPQIAATAGVTGRNARILTGTNYFSSGSIDGQADLPLKIALSAVTIQPGIYWGAIY